MTMKHTNSREFRDAMNNYILDCIDPEVYEEKTDGDKEKVQFLIDCFKKEYGHAIEQKGSIQDALSEYFSGLPSIFNIDFTYYDILQTAKKLHGTEKFTSKEEDKIIDSWFDFVAL